MVHYDAKGIIAIVELAVYLPIMFISMFLVLRHGFRKRAGWIYILAFSLVRVIAAGMHIGSEHSLNNAKLRAGYSTLENVGLSPLLLATLGFLTTVSAGGLDKHVLTALIPNISGALTTAGLTLAIYGGSTAPYAKTLKAVYKANGYRKDGIIILLVVYILIVLLSLWFWIYHRLILKYRKMFFIAITLSLPFLGVRVVYSVLSVYAPPIIPTNLGPTTVNGLSKFGSTGEWQTYFAMSVLMEFVIILIYTFAGIFTPLHQDVLVVAAAVPQADDSEKYAPAHDA